MYSKKQKDVKIQEKGITLIALIITIIVLLILAGVTIASLTGSDSTPAKANEAKQKNDIGAAKDDVSLTVQNALTDAYVSAYVDGNSSKGSASTDVGDYVITTVKAKYDDKPQLGLATITVGADGKITISTTDVTETGSINPVGGILTWDTIPLGNGGNSGEQQSGVDPATIPNSVYSLAKSGTIKRWDSVNYNPGDGTISSLLDTNNQPLAGASLSGTISASSSTNWVVLDVNQTTGEVLIMPKIVSDVTLTLEGIDGYNNAIIALDTVAGIYKNPIYAKSARSITVEDINEIDNIIYEGGEQGMTGMNGPAIYMLDENLNIITNETVERPTFTETVEGYEIAGSFWGTQESWLASRRIDVEGWYTDCGALSISSAFSNFIPIFRIWENSGDKQNANQSIFEYSYCVIPVVTLKADIQLESSSTYYTASAGATVAVEEETGFQHTEWSFKE